MGNNFTKCTNFCLLIIYNMLYFEERGELVNNEIHNNIEETEILLKWLGQD